MRKEGGREERQGEVEGGGALKSSAIVVRRKQGAFIFHVAHTDMHHVLQQARPDRRFWAV